MQKLWIFAAVAAFAHSPAQSQSIGDLLGSVVRSEVNRQVGSSVASYVMTQATLMAVQRRLGVLGYPVGPADGIMGPATRAAIIAWQQSQGRAGTGSLSQDEATALVGAEAAVSGSAAATN